MKVLAAFVATVIMLGAACGEDGDAPVAQSVVAPTASPYSRSKTVACLTTRGATVQKIRPTDPRLRAIRDVAQRQSVEIRLKDARLAVAFGRNIAEAQLLVELLTVPSDPYRIQRRGNVVILYRARDSRTFAIVARCLRR